MKDSKPIFSFAGVGLGAVAFLMAILHFWAGPFSPQPVIEQVVAEKAVAIKQKTIAALSGKGITSVETKKAKNTDKIISLGTAFLGALAIILGVVGFAKREPMRAASGAVFLGSGALFFQFAVVAISVIIVAMLIVAVLSQIGIG